MTQFKLSGEYIALFQLLKATHLCGTGGEAKIMIGEGLVTVDGDVETRLRKKIRIEEVVEYNGEQITVR